ncbi:MAG: DUF5989 family protein [Planctomycetota bacterium]|jgi:hypothetical protein
MSNATEPQNQSQSFRDAGTKARRGLVVEFWGFLKQNKTWWVLAVLLAFVVVGALLVVGGSAAAPFIYTLF